MGETDRVRECERMGEREAERKIENGGDKTDKDAVIIMILISMNFSSLHSCNTLQQ